MSPFTVVNPGDLMINTQVDQILNAWTGVSSAAVPMALTALNDQNNWSLTVQNLDPVNDRALNVMNAQGASMIRVDSSGISFGTPLNLPAGCITTAELANGAVTSAKIGPPVDIPGYFRSQSAGAALPTTGVGLELYWDGTESVVQSYNRNTPAYEPLALWGSSINIYPNAGGELTVNGGLIVTSTLNVSGAAAFSSTLNVTGTLIGSGEIGASLLAATGSASTSPYTQQRVAVYNDNANWAFFAYGTDAQMRIVYSSGSAGLSFGISTDYSNNGTYTERMHLDAAGSLSVFGNLGTSGNLTAATIQCNNNLNADNITIDSATNSAGAKLAFSAVQGSKISLYDSGGGNYFGLGINSSEMYICVPASADLAFRVNNNAGAVLAYFYSTGDVILGPGAPGTTATQGFPFIPRMAGTPSSTPANLHGGGWAPLVYDDGNHRLWVWSAGLSRWVYFTGN